ncbi:TetR/AcrR family transcriptional regulator [Smaragdicoccus niigatensis]|uniref:TetR/AcrR family transcriptional regulator n=1 Tax=Smaragdicoccus niigatensis TaxID=359359 RepID=UPI00035DE5D9|nr:TetR/AcrR family transcriptional regulator [Smaragdicoccus niigatensis]
MDQRRQRHLATKDELISTAWKLTEEKGLAGWSLRELAQANGIKAPSLYVYFPSKDQIYDEMFARSYEDLLEYTKQAVLPEDPRERLHIFATRFFDWAVSNPARLQLMFWRVVPGFEPSENAYAASIQTLDLMKQNFADLGITDPQALDLWTALLSGLISQQVSNEPGGDRWRKLIGQAVDMFADEYLKPARA